MANLPAGWAGTCFVPEAANEPGGAVRTTASPVSGFASAAPTGWRGRVPL
ncbi:MAG TPA: hypothetical protein VJ914_18640 [Pseudonocardiaceae bacterium]|nr:hypothetical protein [Pseudonocardiaceae bacterium]